MVLRRDLLRYMAARLALAPVMLWIIASLVFLLLRVAPGDPVDALLGLRATPAAREALRVQLGLNQPLVVQYFTYLQDLVHGHLGTSLASQESVGRIIGASLPATIELGCMGLLLGALLGLAVGFSGAARPEGSVDLAGRLFGIGTYALPPLLGRHGPAVVFCGVAPLAAGGGALPCHHGSTGATHRLLPDQCASCGQRQSAAGQPAAPGLARLHPGSAAEWNF